MGCGASANTDAAPSTIYQACAGETSPLLQFPCPELHEVNYCLCPARDDADDSLHPADLGLHRWFDELQKCALPDSDAGSVKSEPGIVRKTVSNAAKALMCRVRNALRDEDDDASVYEDVSELERERSVTHCRAWLEDLDAVAVGAPQRPLSMYLAESRHAVGSLHSLRFNPAPAAALATTAPTAIACGAPGLDELPHVPSDAGNFSESGDRLEHWLSAQTFTSTTETTPLYRAVDKRPSLPALASFSLVNAEPATQPPWFQVARLR